MEFLKTSLFALIGVCSLSLMGGCSDDSHANDPEIVIPPLPPSGGDDTPEKPSYIWVDAASNFTDFGDSKDNIHRDLAHAKEVGFTDIVLDVRPPSGDVLYQTDEVDQVTGLYAWVPTGNGGYVYKKVMRTATWDYLQAFIDECRSLGLRIHAGFNTFIAGDNNEGLLYRDSEKAKTWASQLNTADGIVSIMDVPEESIKFLNPANSEVQDHLCRLLADLAKYDLDGIVLDRGRYLDIRSDFSEISHNQFSAYLNLTYNWPDDVLPLGGTVNTQPTPKYYHKWLEYRAKVIYDFMAKARAAVKNVNPNIKFGVYVGAWYGSYYDCGVNWAGKNYDPHKEFAWASERYHEYGYAGLMDHMLLGAYAGPKYVFGSTEWTIQGFCSLGKKKIGGECPLVVGGPDVGNWSLDGVTEQEELKAVQQSVGAAMASCDGYFLFDMIHLKLNPKKWDSVKNGHIGYRK